MPSAAFNAHFEANFKPVRRRHEAELIAPSVAYVYGPDGTIAALLDDTCYRPGGANEGDREPRSDALLLAQAEAIAATLNAIGPH